MIFERMTTPAGPWWREVKVVEADPRDNYWGRYRSELQTLFANMDDWKQIIAPQIVCIGMDLMCPRIVTEPVSDWNDEEPKGELVPYYDGGSDVLAGIASAVALYLGRSLDEWIRAAEFLAWEDNNKDEKQWLESAHLSFEMWKQATSLDLWPRSPRAVLGVEDDMCSLDRMVLRVLSISGSSEKEAGKIIGVWIAARINAKSLGLSHQDHWKAWINPVNNNYAGGAFSIRKDDPLSLSYGLLCPPVVEVVLSVVKAARKSFLMVRTPTVASSTLAGLRRGLSPHTRAEQRGPRDWDLVDAVGRKVAHAEGLDGGPLALLPAGALEQLARSGNEVLRSPTGIRLILGICAIARQRAAGLSNASPHLIFNGLEDLVRQCGLSVNRRTVEAAREVVAAGQMWRWADAHGGAAGLWTYTYHLDGGTGDGRISRLTIVPGLPLLPTRGERGVLLAPLPMLGSLSSSGRLVGGEAQLHLALCAEIQNASASLQEGTGLVCDGELLEQLARESGLKAEQVRAAIERWISEGVLSRETNGGGLWGEARAEARAFIIDQGEHRRIKSEHGKTSVQKRRAAKK